MPTSFDCLPLANSKNQHLSLKKRLLSSAIALALTGACGVTSTVALADNSQNTNQQSKNKQTTKYGSVADNILVFDPLVVTANRLPTKQQSVIADTLVLDEAVLEKYQGQTVLDVIKLQPGFSSYQSGGKGTNGNFYLRGFDGKQILVLIDGIRYSSLSTGQAAINLLPVEQIERIEVVKGASGSSIYGADAMGGVIQIFTKSANNRSNGFSVSAGVGSHDHYKYGVSGMLNNGKGSHLMLSLGHDETKGINATLPSNTYSYNADADGFDSDSISLSMQHQLTDSLSTGLTALYSQSNTEFDTGSTLNDTHAEQKNAAAQAHIKWQYQPNSSIKLQYGRSIDQSKNINTGFDSEYKSTQDQVNLVGHQKLPIGQAVYGAEYLKQAIDTTAFNADDRKVTSGFLGYQLTKNRIDAQVNARYDDNSQYGGETTYNLGAAYRILANDNYNLRIGGSYAKGLRAPTFNELYSSFGGNPKLVPETSDNYEAFVELQTDTNNSSNSTRITGYRNNVNDLISYVITNPKTYAGVNKNIDEATIEGVSLTSDWQFDRYIFGVNYDYQKAIDSKKESSTYENHLPIRPEHKGGVYLGYANNNFNVKAEYQYIDDYFSNVANKDSQKVDGYGLVNLHGNYYFNDYVSLSTRINNLTNKKYVTLPNYNTDGTNYFVSLTYEY